MPIRVGMIGCGVFGKFCLDVYSKMGEIQLVAVSDIDKNTAVASAKQFGIQGYTDPDLLISDQNIDLIHIATPPYLHHSFGIEVLKQKKHVICEKPLAVSVAHANKMISLAWENNVIIPVNFVLRYVPIVDIVKRIIDSGILGQPLHASFENFAADENMEKNHWFWEKEKSGGIFVEHGVHFFDLYKYWFGDMKVLFAHAERRNNNAFIDRVSCFLRHKNGLLSSHYHGFDQPACMDRQLHRILLETGDLSVVGWIPESFTINAVLDEARLEKVQSIIPPSSEINIIESFDDQKKMMKGQGKNILATQKIQVQYNSPVDKQHLYSNAFRDLVLDQINYIKDRNHKRVISEKNGLIALELALEATKISAVF
jgi:predicted dehydrogenase